MYSRVAVAGSRLAEHRHLSEVSVNGVWVTLAEVKGGSGATCVQDADILINEFRVRIPGIERWQIN